MPRVYFVGNAHIDPIWLWRWSEGQQVIRSTFSSAVKLLRERKGLVFSASSAAFYKLVEETDPELFSEVRKLVKKRRWSIVGGWWVEPDCNIPSGEALVRHSLYGQRYFQKKFGVAAKVGFNIDSFGHNATIPQILTKSGIRYYVFRRPNPTEKELPGWIFNWSSPDGSSVIAQRIIDTYSATGERIKSLIGKVAGEISPPVDSLLCFIGQGDHGGGPTIDDVRMVEEARKQAEPVELKFAPMEEFFEKAEKVRDKLPVVADELQHHASGCYAALSKIKGLNRKAEEALVAAEKYNFMANVLVGTKYFDDELRKAWTNVLFCQFHDVLAGSCIREAYDEDVYPMMGEALSIANRVTNVSTQAIAAKVRSEGDLSVVVFNPHAYPVKAPLEVDWLWRDKPTSLKDEKLNAIQCQRTWGSSVVGNSASMVFVADLPPLGYRTFGAVSAEHKGSAHTLQVGDHHLENDWLRVEFDGDGTIGKLILKEGGERVMLRGGAKALVLKDESDTWSHGVYRYDDEIGQFKCDGLEVVENGPVRAIIRAKYKYGNSTLRQEFILYRELDYLICRLSVDWHEKLKLLKLAFPVNVHDPVATYEIQYGSVKRPTNGMEEPGLRWVDVSGRFGSTPVAGVTIVNDAKYSYDVRGNELRLTVLRSPVFAHHAPTQPGPKSEPKYVDQGQQSFTYILRPHRGALNPREAIEIADALTAPPLAIVESEHDGTLPSSMSLVNVSGENVILKVIKKAEGRNAWILRMYETSGKRVKSTVSIPALRVKFQAELKPYEIKTYSVSHKRKRVKEVNLIEE